MRNYAVQGNWKSTSRVKVKVFDGAGTTKCEREIMMSLMKMLLSGNKLKLWIACFWPNKYFSEVSTTVWVVRYNNYV